MTLLGMRTSVEGLARLLDAPDGADSVPVVRRLQTARPALEARTAPHPEFRSALRTRLLAVAAVQADAPASTPEVRSRRLGRTAPAAATRRGQRRLGVTAGALASVVAFAGLGVASSRSLPGDPFYGLKRSAERVQFGLAGGAVDRGAAQLEFAATRLREVKGLTYGRQVLSLSPFGSARVMAGAAAGGALTRRVEAALGDMDGETRSGRLLLEAAYRSSHRQEPLRLLMTFSATQDDSLSHLMSALPVGARPRAQRSLQFVRTVGTDTAALLALAPCTGSCSPAPGAPGAPGLGTTRPGASPCTCASPAPTVRPVPGVPGGPGASAAPTAGASASVPGAGPAPSRLPSPRSNPVGPPAPQPGTTPVPLPVPVPTPTPPHPGHLAPPVPVPVPVPVPGLPTPPVHLRAP